MLRAWSHTRRQAGFSPVEALLAATVFGAIVVAVAGAVIFGRASTAQAGERNRATLLAEEGVEAVRNMRDAAFSNLADGTYGLVKSGNVWTLSGTSDTSGIFTRSVTIATVDSTRKSVTSNVSWTLGTDTSQVNVVGQLTNWSASIASWANAVLAGSYNATGTNNGFKVTTQGNYAYLVRNISGTTNFFIVNISNSAAPTLVGSLTLASTPTDVAVSGNYAYVSNSSTSTELQIVNITTPATPALAGTYNAPGTAGGGLSVAASGTTVYLGRSANTANGEICIINTATPATPVLLGKYNQNIAMNDIAVQGSYLYAVTNSLTNDMIILAISNPAAPTLAGVYNSSTLVVAATGLAVLGNRAYVAAGSIVTSVDITTPTPSQLGSYTLTGTGAATDAELDDTGNYLFVGSANTSAELRVLNTSNPAAMTLAKTLDVTGTASTISGLAYNAALGLVLGASASDTQELVIFKKN